MLHRLEGRRADTVGEQRGSERGGPAAAAIDCVCLTLHCVERRSAHGGDRRPSGEFSVVRGLANGRIGVRSQTSNGRHRQCRRAAVGQRHGRGELRGDHTVQLRPRGRPCVDEFAVEPLVGLAHLVLGAGGQFRQRALVFRSPVADGGQLVDSECSKPIRQPGREWPQARIDHLRLAQKAGCLLLVAVRGGGAEDECASDVAVLLDHVHRIDHGIGGCAIGGGDRTRLDAANAVLFEQRLQPGHVGCAAVHRVEEGTSLQGLVHVGHAPAWERH